ncbi:tRNA 2-thiocytidine biosynthesis protein TtcA [Caloramator sp. E03]|uniref:tRNA 2-thiocytidine biosynthesis TtcA family protein n=1 Tax=Caloramator sp. E03 TaxID=2576307 RepID=UPI0011101869|nr:ATP-binding protein [Caloramator sp. E03]QCX34735.1 tRNA 2-thiocytidine biosynthesis protein TtcA [Caloramator sp. E03]
MEKLSNNRCERSIYIDEKKPLYEIERSIVTKFRHHIWGKFIKAISDYNMVEEGDKIAVAVSGGKDSLLMAKLFQQLKRMNKIKFDLEFIVADPGYHEDIKEILLDNCRHLNIPIHIYESGIFEIVDRIAKDYPCFMCAKMRRGALYSKAKELGCNKLALGHHFDDVIETVLLNMFFTGCFKTMLPKVKSRNFEGMELIRPLYYIKEHYIECYTKENGIYPINCACMVAAKRTGNKRYEIKDLIKDLKLKFKDIDKHIFTATQNVNMDAILGWQKDGKKYSYLNFYDENEEE